MNIPNIKNAYENVRDACEQRLKELYPQRIPSEARNRLDKELKYLKNSNYIDDFEIARLLYEEASKSSQYLTCRGTLSGSFIFYLISSSRTNPLPPHYICPNCGEVKKIKSKLFGIDYPECDCPSCNTPMNSDGYNIGIESVWGLDGKSSIGFEYNTSREFYPFIKRLLNTLYPQNAVEPYGISYFQDGAPSVDLHMAGYVVLSDDQTINDYSDLIGYLENGDICISGNSMEIIENNMKRILLFNDPMLSTIVAMQRNTGIYIDSITTKELRDIPWNIISNTKVIGKQDINTIKFYKPKTKTELINLLSASHSTYTCIPYESEFRTEEIVEMIKSSDFIKYPCYTREDVYDHLIELGIDSQMSFKYSEIIRKGLHNNRSQQKEIIESLSLPEKFMNVLHTIQYLFPRAHSTEYALAYSILGYYLNADSKIYSITLSQIQEHRF